MLFRHTLSLRSSHEPLYLVMFRVCCLEYMTAGSLSGPPWGIEFRTLQRARKGGKHVRKRTLLEKGALLHVQQQQ